LQKGNIPKSTIPTTKSAEIEFVNPVSAVNLNNNLSADFVEIMSLMQTITI